MSLVLKHDRIVQNRYEGGGSIVGKTDRTKVTIHCNVCGERYILRGRRGHEGKVETGFKQCLCNNERHFDVVETDV